MSLRLDKMKQTAIDRKIPSLMDRKYEFNKLINFEESTCQIREWLSNAIIGVSVFLGKNGRESKNKRKIGRKIRSK